MNTDVGVVCDRDEDRVIGEVAAVFAEAEQRFSRFRDDSELARLNRAATPVEVSQPMFDALLAARRHVEWTGGIFDPAIGAALISAGYDKSFSCGLDRDDLPAPARRPVENAGGLDMVISAAFSAAYDKFLPGALDRDLDGPAPRSARFLDVGLDRAARRVTRPAGVQIDLGGLIKGRTVDLAAAMLPGDGAVDAGGDAVIRGEGLVDIEDPRDPAETLMTLTVCDIAVATSSPNRRKWRVANSVRHHLIDPRTQRPASTDLLQVTIIAATAELADVLAKTVFVLGAIRGREFLERRPEIGGVLVPSTGTPILCGRLEVLS